VLWQFSNDHKLKLRGLLDGNVGGLLTCRIMLVISVDDEVNPICAARADSGEVGMNKRLGDDVKRGRAVSDAVEGRRYVLGPSDAQNNRIEAKAAV
jgi:hypothetical protein